MEATIIKAIYFEEIIKKFEKTFEFFQKNPKYFLYIGFDFFSDGDKDNILGKFINSLGVYVEVVCKTDDIPSIMRDEELYEEQICPSPLSEDEFKEAFRKAIINVVADGYAKKGFSHKAVVWALWNNPQSNWILPAAAKTNPIEVRKEELKAKFEFFKIKKMCQSLIDTFGKKSVREVTFTGIDREDHGYTDYDLQTGNFSGYKVNCWSSFAFGGNCSCNSHDPGEDISGQMTIDDVKRVESILSSSETSTPDDSEEN